MIAMVHRLDPTNYHYIKKHFIIEPVDSGLLIVLMNISFIVKVPGNGAKNVSHIYMHKLYIKLINLDAHKIVMMLEKYMQE
jgi:hypothetical protein